VTTPFILVQLSDPHVGADWGDADTAAMLAAAVESVRSLPVSPSAVLVSGDLADSGADVHYQQVRDLLAPLAVPLYVLAGNHDDPAALRRHFGIPGRDGEPVQYSADLGPLRLVVLDSTRAGADSGELDPDRLAWLDEELAAAPDRTTILAMHHAPLLTGVPAFDELGLPAHDLRALGRVLERHRQVRRLVCGHVHRTIAAELGGCPVLAVPSTYLQARLDFRPTELELVAEPPGFAIHVLVGGEVVSHIQPVS
jgi:Icc protein